VWLYEEGTDIPNLAAHLLLAIGGNHPFEQGNKANRLRISLDISSI
jgi:prophage maintenance system killer protein